MRTVPAQHNRTTLSRDSPSNPSTIHPSSPAQPGRLFHCVALPRARGQPSYSCIDEVTAHLYTSSLLSLSSSSVEVFSDFILNPFFPSTATGIFEWGRRREWKPSPYLAVRKP